MKKRIFFASLIGCLSLLPVCRAQELADVILAVVNDSPVTLHELDSFTKQDERFLVERYRDQPEILRRKVIDMRQSALELLINRDVILADSKESLKGVPESIIDEIVNDRIREKYTEKIGIVGLTKQLQLDGMTMEQLRKQFRDQLILEQMRIKNVPDPIISPLRVENYYKAHQAEFKVEDEIKMRMIFLSKESADKAEATRRRAEEILSQINGGASFEELAKSYSEGSLRDQGGETGWEEISVVNKALVDELNKLKPGGHSGVIDTPEGFYILLLEDRHPVHFKPLKEVRAEIEATLDSREKDRLQTEWVERLKKKTYSQMF